MKNQNFLLSNFILSGSTPVSTPEIECVPGDETIWDVVIELLSGAPTTASIAATFQLAPVEYDGFNMNTDWSTGVGRPWITVAAGTDIGHLLKDGAWPTSLADQTWTVHKFVSRRLIIPALCTVAKLVLTPAFTGGVSPLFRVTVAVATAD